MKLKALAAVLSALTFAPAFAAPETYALDASHTYPRFSYSHFGFSKQLSRFNKTSGTVVLDKAAKTGSVDVTIDMKSVDTGSDLFDQHIQGADFLDTANHPTATFKSTKVVFDGDKPARVEGNLTIKGVTKPLTLTGELSRTVTDPWGNQRTSLAVTGKLSREAFGLVWNMALEFGGFMVSDEVKLHVEAEAVAMVPAAV